MRSYVLIPEAFRPVGGIFDVAARWLSAWSNAWGGPFVGPARSVRKAYCRQWYWRVQSAWGAAILQAGMSRKAVLTVHERTRCAYVHFGVLPFTVACCVEDVAASRFTYSNCWGF